MKLIVGLGNPTPRYALTRHNAGFICLDLLATEHGLTWTENKKLQALQAQGEVSGTRCLLLKPQTWMNHSGQAVAAAVNFFRLTHDDVLVLYDDLDVPAGRVKCKVAGRSGGHKGVQSIIDCLRSQNFHRIKLGVARPLERGAESGAGSKKAANTPTSGAGSKKAANTPTSGAEWVLEKFSAAELEVLRTEMYEQVLLRLRQIFSKAQA